eukprot:g749.t1
MRSVQQLIRRAVPQKSVNRGRPSKNVYDYIVIGAGSAGCLIANELSSGKSQKKVLILEAGGWAWNPLIHIPAGVYSVFKNPSLNWNLESEPSPLAGNRQIELPRGKVVGGSSAINACVYMRGHPKDYDNWAQQYNLSEWDYTQCLHYFKRCESSDRGASEYRGGSGRLSVTKGCMENPLYDALLDAGRQSGQGVSEDLNAFMPEGLARLDRTTTQDGYRCSSADAHLIPALQRENLELVTRATVNKLILDGKQITGVCIDVGGSDYIINANSGVVVCAGAIKTPQLLMLSGIGNREDLALNNIDCRHHLPGVGQNLQDHACINIAFHASPGTRHISLAGLSSPMNKISAGSRWLIDGTGPAASNIWEGGGLVYGQHGGFDRNCSSNLDAPNLQYHFCPVFSSYSGRELNLYPGFQIQVDQLRPHSRGSVHLRSPRPTDNPVVQFNYLSDDRDVAELVDGFKTAQELLSQPAFDKFRGSRGIPSNKISSDAEIEHFVRTNSGTDYHPCGTCKMSGDEDDELAVVDSTLRVRGLEKLHIADASVIPNIVSGNLNAPVQMIAMKAADMLLKRTPSVQKRPKFHFESHKRCFSLSTLVKQPKCIIFDKDGTLLDVDATWGPVLVETCRRIIKPADDIDFYDLLGLDITTMRFREAAPFAVDTNETIRSILLSNGYDADKFLKSLDDVCKDVAFCKMVPICDDLSPIFNDLKSRNLKIAILTSDDRANCEIFLDHEGLSVDAMVCGDDGRGSKPSAEPIESIATDLMIDTSEIIMVGDSSHDIDSATSAGATSVGVLSGVGTAVSLSRADFVLSSIVDIPNLIDEIM